MKRIIVGFESVVEEIRQQDLLDLRFMFPELASPKWTGLYRAKIKCPFHNEKTPSLVYFLNSASYCCLGCGASGDNINYYAERKRITHLQAIVELARIYKIELKWENVTWAEQ